MHDLSDQNFTIFGRNPERVLALLTQRRLSKTKNDGRKFGLVIEGGGMRGIIAGGILLALHERVDTEIFDILYGTSAGALGGAFFLSGQTPYGIAIYFEDLATDRFINLARIPPRFNIDYLIDTLEYKRKLDVAAVKEHAVELVITATEITNGEQHYFGSHTDIPLLAAIKASCALPIMYDKPVEVKSKRYLDGGTINDSLVNKAVADGCTDILLLFTRPRERTYHATKLSRRFEAARLKKYGPRFAATFCNRGQSYERALQLIETTGEVNMAVIAPRHQTLTISTINPKRLKQAYLLSYHFMRDRVLALR